MTFSGHIATATFVLALTQQLAWVIVLCIVLHLLIDAIPHVELKNLAQSSNTEKALMSTDLLCTLSLIISLYSHFSHISWLITLAIVCSVLPDLTDSLAHRYCAPFRRLHKLMHTWPAPVTDIVNWDLTVTGRTPTWLKVLMQTVLVVGALIYLKCY